ncbi:hypothetical protein PITC_069540 [Penicillium italicum]|uniref:Uncharacterized protein n=1 Tax=Penicillium italicum TaxID=40296 RepID=A0A0A2KZV3_PENIT|nr:hypothetical protein PITC_069540 [Penicillium italicum]
MFGQRPNTQATIYARSLTTALESYYQSPGSQYLFLGAAGSTVVLRSRHAHSCELHLFLKFPSSGSAVFCSNGSPKKPYRSKAVVWQSSDRKYNQKFKRSFQKSYSAVTANYQFWFSVPLWV